MSGLARRLGPLVAPLIAHRVTPVLLYHSTFEHVPTQLDSSRLHNVRPDDLVAQVTWLSHHHRFITIDDWFDEPSPGGTACLTFDDGYKCVFDEALPRLIELGVPSTVFLNGSTFDGSEFWRDRVAYVINNALVDDFLASIHGRSATFVGMTADNFYTETKSPARSSRSVDMALTAYLDETGRAHEVGRFTVNRFDQLIDDPLVSYGCHTYRHYMPSSLTYKEQEEELVANTRMLGQLDLQRSGVFSIPFGGSAAVNADTARLLKQLGYRGVVFSRNAVNFDKPGDFLGVASAERYMVPSDLTGLQERHARLGALPPQSLPRRAVRRARKLRMSGTP